ncbi:hypothetical protein JW935_05700 [candidate division KSB1 bacterium]|nr:hypothetical protein [candidate division KSB1 bacterium]
MDNSHTFQGRIFLLNFDFQVSRFFHFNQILQYDSNLERLRFETVLGYEMGMGNKILLSYKSAGRAVLRQVNYPDDVMTISLKASWLFRV